MCSILFIFVEPSYFEMNTNYKWFAYPEYYKERQVSGHINFISYSLKLFTLLAIVFDMVK